MLKVVFDCSDNKGLELIPDNVTYLRLCRCGLTDVSFLAKYDALVGLDLSENKDITDVAPLT